MSRYLILSVCRDTKVERIRWLRVAQYVFILTKCLHDAKMGQIKPDGQSDIERHECPLFYVLAPVDEVRLVSN